MPLGLLLSECSFLIFNQDLQATQKLSRGDQGTYKLVNAIFIFSFHLSVKKSSKQLAWKNKWN